MFQRNEYIPTTNHFSHKYEKATSTDFKDWEIGYDAICNVEQELWLTYFPATCLSFTEAIIVRIWTCTHHFKGNSMLTLLKMMEIDTLSKLRRKKWPLLVRLSAGQKYWFITFSKGLWDRSIKMAVKLLGFDNTALCSFYSPALRWKVVRNRFQMPVVIPIESNPCKGGKVWSFIGKTVQNQALFACSQLAASFTPVRFAESL